MMTIMGKRFTNRGISTIIAALLLIAIAIAAGVLLYVFSMGLIGSLQGSGGQQVKDQVIMEAYQWTTVNGPVTLNLRNTGATTVNLQTADYYFAGIQMTGVQFGTCNGGTAPSNTNAAFGPGTACPATITLAGLTPTAGVAYTVKIALSDGGVMSYSAVAGSSG
jgi:flagellin-like protein